MSDEVFKIRTVPNIGHSAPENKTKCWSSISDIVAVFSEDKIENNRDALFVRLYFSHLFVLLLFSHATSAAEAKLAARVQADEETVRRKTEFTAASKFEQQQRYVSRRYINEFR